jgi:hypothetical protein
VHAIRTMVGRGEEHLFVHLVAAASQLPSVNSELRVLLQAGWLEVQLPPPPGHSDRTCHSAAMRASGAPHNAPGVCKMPASHLGI